MLIQRAAADAQEASAAAFAQKGDLRKFAYGADSSEIRKNRLFPPWFVRKDFAKMTV